MWWWKQRNGNPGMLSNGVVVVVVMKNGDRNDGRIDEDVYSGSQPGSD